MPCAGDVIYDEGAVLVLTRLLVKDRNMETWWGLCVCPGDERSSFVAGAFYYVPYYKGILNWPGEILFSNDGG